VRQATQASGALGGNPHGANPQGAEAWARRIRRDWVVFLLAGLVLLVIAALAAGSRAGSAALDQSLAQAATAARLKVAVLRAEIEKHRSLPFVLAEDPEVAALLAAPGDPARVDHINRRLEELSRGTRVGVIYLLNDRGKTLAASNWQAPDSFVGQDYSFRPYFRDALANGTGEHFALGSMSHRPGLYLARRVGDEAGVVVIKLEFDALEAEWAEDAMPVLVADARGIVLLTDRADWRFRTLAPLPPETLAALHAGLQFGDAPLDPLPLALAPEGGTARIGGADYATVVQPVPGTAWTLHLFAGLEPGRRQAETSAALLAALAVLVAMGPAGLLLRRRHRGVERRARDARHREVLEAEVAARTADLVAVNAKLSAEIAERQLLQDELAQANRLAILGQIAASVAHEINQPVAAIRAYADNAAVFLDRADGANARANLGLIAGLTEKIGAITGQLRNFARRTSGAVGPVEVAAVVEGALLLLGPRLRRQDARVTKKIADGLPPVQGKAVRLEQVLVNLLQNALDAAPQAPAITIEAGLEDGQVVIRVADNGPGLAPEVMARLFTPFVTSKPSGLGLGLVISSDIVKDFGGTLGVENSPQGGAIFSVRLKPA